MPKRKPKLVRKIPPPSKDAKPPTAPKKFTAFSPSDSRRLEARYQKLLEAVEDGHASQPRDADAALAASPRGPDTKRTGSAGDGGIRVPVNEDFLFHVDIEERELAPVYWLGPVYEGT